MVRRLNLYGGDRIEDAIAALKALSQAFPGENFFVKFNNIYVFPFDIIGSYLRKMHDGGVYLKEQLESHPEYDLKEMEQAVGFDYSAKPDPAKVEEAVLHYLRSVEKERRGNMHKVADSSIYFSPVVISDDKYDSDLSVFDVEPVIEVRGLRHDGGNEVWGLVRQENLDDFDSDIDYNEDWRRLDVSELLKVLEGNKDLAKKVKAPVVLDYGIGIDELSAELPEEDLAALDGLGLSKEDIDFLSKTGRLKGEDFDFVIKDDGRVWCCTVETAVRLEDAIKHVEEEERKDSVSIDLSRGKGI